MDVGSLNAHCGRHKAPKANKRDKRTTFDLPRGTLKWRACRPWTRGAIIKPTFVGTMSNYKLMADLNFATQQRHELLFIVVGTTPPPPPSTSLGCN